MDTLYNKKLLHTFTLLFLVSGFLILGPISAVAQVTKSETIIADGKGRHKHSYKSGSVFGSFSIDYRGEIALTDDEKDIKSISPGGYFKVSKTTFGTKRLVKIENKGGDQLVRTFYVGRNKEPYYPDGQKWLADILPDIIREIGLGAAQRVTRIFKKSGTDGVLDEIQLIRGDYVKAKYFSALLDLPGISENDFPRILYTIGSDMDSSYEMGKLLARNSGRFLEDDASAKAFFRTSSRLSSDYEKSKLLIKVLDEPNISDEAFKGALDAAASISSDYESGKVLRSVLKNDDLSDDKLGEVMEIVGDISSDHEKSKVLQSLMDRTFDDVVFEAILNSSQEISSDYEKSKVLRQLIDNQDLNNERLGLVLNAVEDISSDYEKKNTIKRLINDHEIDQSNLKLLLTLVDDMSSSYEQSNIYKLIIDEIDLSDENMISMLSHVEGIQSDYEKTNILIKIAEEASERGEKVKSAYLQAAKSVSSDHSYGRVMRAFEY